MERASLRRELGANFLAFWLMAAILIVIVIKEPTVLGVHYALIDMVDIHVDIYFHCLCIDWFRLNRGCNRCADRITSLLCDVDIHRAHCEGS